MGGLRKVVQNTLALGSGEVEIRRVQVVGEQRGSKGGDERSGRAETSLVSVTEGRRELVEARRALFVRICRRVRLRIVVVVGEDGESGGSKGRLGGSQSRDECEDEIERCLDEGVRIDARATVEKVKMR